MGPGLLLSRHGEVILETSAPVLTWELRKGREAGLCQTRRSGGTANASADSARTACTGPCLLFNPPRGLAQCLPGRHSRHAKSTSAATFSNSYDLATAPPPPPSRSQTRGAGGERRRAVICYGHLHCPVTRHVPLLPVHSQSRLHFGKLDSDGESKLVSRQWRRSGSQTGGSCWRESRGYAEPGEVRTNPATVRAESGSTAGVISAKAVRAMQLSTGPPGKRSPETKTMSSFHQQFLFVKRRMVNALWL